MAAGRPRTVSPPPEELEALGKEMVDWLANSDCVHVSDWYCFEKGFTDKAWETMTDRKEFIPYYEAALKIVGRKYLVKDSPIEPSLKQRWQRVYFKDLRKSEDKDLDDAALRAKEANKQDVPEGFANGMIALMKQFGMDQSAFKMEESKIKSEQKS